MTAGIGFCTVVYDGAKATADHLRKSIRLKGIEFPHGAEVTIPADMAGMLIRSQPRGAVVVKSGEPVYNVPVPGSIKAAARRDAQFRAQYPVDPVRALDSIRAIEAATLKLLSGKDADAIAAIEAGKLDADLVSVAIWLAYGGRPEVAAAAARRAETIRPKA